MNDFQGAGAAPQMNMSSILNAPNVTCSCGSKIFTQAFVLKRISSLVSPTGREETIEIPLFVCAKCGEIPSVYRDNPQFKKIFGETEIKKD